MHLKIEQHFETFFWEMRQEYRIFAPIKRSGKGAFSDTGVIDYGEVQDPAEIVWTEKSYFSPKSVIYPIVGV